MRNNKNISFRLMTDEEIAKEADDRIKYKELDDEYYAWQSSYESEEYGDDE